MTRENSQSNIFLRNKVENWRKLAGRSRKCRRNKVDIIYADSVAITERRGEHKTLEGYRGAEERVCLYVFLCRVL